MKSADVTDELGFDRSPTFLRAGDEAFDAAPAYGHIFRRATGELGLLGVYTLRPRVATAGTPPVPVVYICRSDSEEEADRIHQLVWNQNVVPFLIVQTPRSYRLYSGFQYERRPARRAKDVLRTFNAADELADAGFHADAIDDGTIWRRWGSNVKPEARVDWALLANLKTLDQWLQRHSLSPDVSHALIGKYVYLHYLRDRQILSDRMLRDWGIHAVSVFGRTATMKGLGEVVKRLDYWLNGSVFPLALRGPDAPGPEHVRRVAATFAGDEPSEGEGWQLHLDFKAYDFSYIPIETLSVVYEQFLHASSGTEQSRGREAGAYYTPIPVVNFMLAEMEDRRPLSRDVRVLDPACGSGAFLVQCFRRLIEREFPPSGQRPRPVQLRDLLQRSIFGIDRDPDACSVTELSLILTLLDYCNPPDLKNGTRFKLPSLRGQNILCQNFFSAEPDCFTVLGHRKFDWVVGNPPWRKLNPKKLTDDDKPAWEWMTAQRGQGIPIGGNQVAQAFAWEVERYLNEGGQVGLLLPAMTLFEDPSQDFRAEFFRRFRVSSLANFANLAEVLFAGRSRVPAAAVFYSSRNETIEQTNGEAVTVYSPLVANQEPTRPVAESKRNEIWSLVFNASEVRDVSLEDAATGNGLPWKLALWGSHFDQRLLAKVACRFKAVADLVDDGQLLLAEGPQLRASAGEGLEWCEEMVGKRVLDADALVEHRHLFAFPPGSLTENQNAFLRLRGGKRGLSVCRPPHIIVSAARNFAIYTEDYLIVPPRQIGITSPTNNKLFLKALALYLNSDFAYYQQFLTSTELGVKRDRATLDALRAMPTPITALPGDMLQAWAKLHDRLVVASERALPVSADSEATLFERRPERTSEPTLDSLLSELNETVYEALGLRARERALVEDLVGIRLELNDGKLGQPAVRPPGLPDLKRYGRRLKAELDCFVGESLQKRHSVEIGFDTLSGLVRVQLLPSSASIDVHVAPIDDTAARELQKLRHRLRRQRSQWVYFDRNCLIFEGNSTFLLKPMQRFHWTQSQAMLDAGEIISRTLAGGGQHVD